MLPRNLNLGLVLDVDFKPFAPIDRSVYGNILTNFGSIWTLNGRLFDGTDDYINCGSNASLNISGNLTIGVTVKFNSDYTSTQNIVSNTLSGGNGNYILEFGRTDNKITFLNSGAGVVATSTRSISDNNTYHIVVTRTGVPGNWEINIYINGSLDSTFTGIALNPSSTVGNTVFGILVPPSLNKLNGTISEVKIWNRALTPFDVQKLYQEGKRKVRV